MTASRARQRAATVLAVPRLAAWYLTFGVLKYVLPLGSFARWTWRDPRRARQREVERLLVERVKRVQRLLGGLDRDCLQRSLLLYRELSRAGADPVLVVGFRRAQGRLRGHAWIVADNDTVAEGDVREFVEMVRFGRRGVPMLQPQPQAH